MNIAAKGNRGGAVFGSHSIAFMKLDAAEVGAELGAEVLGLRAIE